MAESVRSHTHEPAQEEVGFSGANNQWRILLADDSERYRKRVVTFLRSRGYVVNVVENGRRLIDKLDLMMNAGWQYDLIITDNQMISATSNVTGMQVLQYIRGNERSEHLPVIVLSDSDIRKAVEDAGGSFFRKEDNLLELGVLVKDMLGQARQPSR